MPIYRLSNGMVLGDLGRFRARGQGGKHSEEVDSASGGGLVSSGPAPGPERTTTPLQRGARAAELMRPLLRTTATAPTPSVAPRETLPRPSGRPGLSPGGAPADGSLRPSSPGVTRPGLSPSSPGLSPSSPGVTRPGLSPSAPSASAPPASSGGGATASDFAPIYAASGGGSSSSSSSTVVEQVVPGPDGRPVTIVVDSGTRMPWWGWALIAVGGIGIGALTIRGLR